MTASVASSGESAGGSTTPVQGSSRPPVSNGGAAPLPAEGCSRPSASSGGAGPLAALLAGARGVCWWISSVMGDNAYARYVDHLARLHPQAPVPTEREYWRQRHADADANPGARCC